MPQLLYLLFPSFESGGADGLVFVASRGFVGQRAPAFAVGAGCHSVAQHGHGFDFAAAAFVGGLPVSAGEAGFIHRYSPR
jgi:hypothetical protein